ncbi:NADH dehydrogenase subunit 4 [Thermoanaerobacterium thermosaccharolyticum]|jgi:hypothetical protein|uniref:NADH dehydrogenase subunit 4 n=1 Tax=Thermoanaerobacterium thermosaccharolyticum TaxID=1517 RepID=A0A223HYT9_THETR|nr:NADH dehydrogenase subunit 4 [Thermoanaerobacterium thermosaccharolyticum]
MAKMLKKRAKWWQGIVILCRFILLQITKNIEILLNNKQN